MSRYETIDIESVIINGVHCPIHVSITNGDSVLSFSAFDFNYLDVCKFILKSCKKSKIYYVHNLSYDCFVLLKYFSKLNCSIEWLCVKKNVYFLKVNDITMKCSYRIMPAPLDKLATIMLGEGKKVFPINILSDVNSISDNVIVRRDMFNSVTEFKSFISTWGYRFNFWKVLKFYCDNDVIILKKVVITFIKQLLSLNISFSNSMFSAPGISIKNFFSKFNDKKIVTIGKYSKYVGNVPKSIHKRYDRILRNGYFGGRTEVFGNAMSSEKVLHFDFSGMYGECMKYKIPGGEYYYKLWDGKTPKIFEEGFYCIEFYQDMYYPILPTRGRTLEFRNGIGSGIYWFEEINLFLNSSNKNKVIRVFYKIGFTEYDNFLKTYIERLEEIKKISDVHKYIGKLLINSLYGRFGMSDRIVKWEIDSVQGDESYKLSDSIFINKVNEKLDKVCNVGLAACITSKARIRLYNGFLKVIENGGRILYCDTDSIFAAFDRSIEIENKLIGEIVFDTNKSDTVIKDSFFCLPKTYSLIYDNGVEVSKIKGFKRKVSVRDMRDMFLNNKKMYFEEVQWKRSEFDVRTYSVKKKLNVNLYDKRIWCNEFYTIPIKK